MVTEEQIKYIKNWFKRTKKARYDYTNKKINDITNEVLKEE